MRRVWWVAAILAIGLCTIGRAQAPALQAHLHHTFGPFPAMLRQVAFSPDSQWLAISSVDGTVKLWRVSDRTLA
jgi:WD40 repeat protein